MFRLHRSATLTLFLSALFAIAPFLAGAFINDGLSDLFVVALAFSPIVLFLPLSRAQ